MVEEMLYDFATRELDPTREADVKEEVDKSKTLQEELARINLGLTYFESLSRVNISLSLLEELKGQKTYWTQIREQLNFQKWPAIVKWTLEAFSIIFIVALLTIFVPWSQIRDFVLQESQTELIIAEVAKSKTRMQQSSEIAQATDFEDEGTSVSDTEPMKSEIQKGTTNLADFGAEKKPVEAKPSVQQAMGSLKSEESKKQGFVFRGTVKVINVDVGAVKIKQKIVDLGGRKAGEVELGWRRNQGDFYFHFTIPESKLNEVQEYIKSLGEMQISRDPHPRLMPDGIVRIILTAEESPN